MRLLPTSFVFFLITAVAMLLQVIPFTGIFLMFLLAPVWSVVLINLGMLGTAFEAASGRVSRWWLIVPLAWFGLYAVAVVRDNAALNSLRAQVATDNSHVRVPFNPGQQSLVLVEDNPTSSNIGAEWIVENYALPVVYTYTPASRFSPARYLATQLVRQNDCKKVREIPGALGADIFAFGFHDDQPGRFAGRLNRDFCTLRQPESPTLPQIRVLLTEHKEQVNRLPTVQTTTVIETPGKAYRLRGGSAAPLRWFPMLAMGCALNSAASSWDCDWGFLRARSEPLADTGERYRNASFALAKALGLHRVSPSERRGAPSELVTASIQRITARALATDIADLEQISGDPYAKIDSIPFRVLSMRPDVLSARAEQIMLALENAVSASHTDQSRMHDNGRNLANLIARLPGPQFTAYGARVLALYAAVEDDHWLWDTELLLRRIGDLGAIAIPIAIQPRGMRPNVNGAGIEALCRIGLPARGQATQLLTQAWADTRDFDREERLGLFVAMRRIGITVPPLVSDKREQMGNFLKDWDDVSPRSPRRVCGTRREEQARREEKYGGHRRTNLD